MDEALAAAMEKYAKSGYGPAKALLVTVALLVGFGTAVYVSLSSVPVVSVAHGAQVVTNEYTHFDWAQFAWWILPAIVIAILYVLLGASAIACCEYVKRWAYLGTSEPWGTGSRLVFAAFFLPTAVCCLLVYLFLGVIHRAFPFSVRSESKPQAHP